MKPKQIQKWSQADIFGLVNGISTWDSQYKQLQYVRSPGETILELRDKIFRMHDNPPGTDKQGLINGISNELNLTVYNTKHKSIFELTRIPVPVGSINTQDIFCYYKQPDETDWTLLTQVWSENYSYYDSIHDGFIVWEDSHYNIRTDIKNFNYSQVLEILRVLENNTQIKVIYYVESYDIDRNRQIYQFTDINNPSDKNDIKFTYNASETPNISGQVIAYTLNNIPDDLSSYYYNSDNSATELLYSIKDTVDSKFRHKWKDLKNNSSIWDVHKNYGSGHLPTFYDSTSPIINSNAIVSCYSDNDNSNYLTGGLEYIADSLYLKELQESYVSNTYHWYPILQPGKFYIDGIPFYLFQDESKEYLTFSNGQATLPTDVQRGTHVILAKSGFYDESCFTEEEADPVLSGIYEDYSYPTGSNGSAAWGNIYHRKANLSTINQDLNLDYGDYTIDFDNSLIYGSGIIDAEIIYDNSLIPSGRLIEEDLNPMNDVNRTFRSYFMFLSLKTRYY